MPYFFNRQGLRLYYNSWGSGQPVALVHGWPLSSETWELIALRLAEHGYRAVSYDRRGFGRSEKPWSGYDYGSLANDLSDLIEYLELDECVGVGFSMGGGEIAAYADRETSRPWKAVALISSIVPALGRSGDNPDGVDSATFDSLKHNLARDRPAAISSFLKEFYGDHLFHGNVSDELFAWTRGLALQASLPATLACVDVFSQADFRRSIRTWSTPTLVIHGSEDAVVPIDPTGRAAASAIAGAVLREYDGAPHGLLATHGEQVAEDLLAFLGRVG
ncbi:MAG: alpha/beta hydrolase [Planctomycetales bacterium]|nr:alpha/beta hydrolase [Planctomycetales bacterium]